MQGFDLVTLRLFLAIARLGSIGAAARSEHLVPSAVSRRISDLEHELDTALVIRTPSGASLTPAGKAFTLHCEEILAKYADTRTDLKRFAEGRVGRLRIAAIPRAIDSDLPFVISQFEQNNPQIEITLSEIYSRQGIRLLREDQADMAIVHDSVNMKGMENLPFKKDTIWIVGHKTHPLFQKYKRKNSILFKDTLDYDHISYHDGGVLDTRIAEARKKEKKPAKSKIRLWKVHSLLRCVEAGLGLGIISDRDLQQTWRKQNLKSLRIADDWASSNLVCVFPKGNTASPVVKVFLDYLGEKIL